MPIQYAEEVAEDRIMEAARAVAAAALGAPQVTGRANIRAVIVSGDDLQVFVDYLLPLCGPDGRLNTYMFGDMIAVRSALEQGTPMAIVAVGGNCFQSELAWNCGACGFETCAEFNKWSKENIGPGAVGMGPSCNWKALDIGLAQAFAVSAAYQQGVTGRLHYSYGGAAMRTGVLEGCNIAAGVSVGPINFPVWDHYYNRPFMSHTFTLDDVYKMARQVFPHQFAGFCGRGDPPWKYAPAWTKPAIYWRTEEDPEYAKARLEGVKGMMAVVAKYKEKLKKK